MNAALPLVLDYPFPTPPPPGTTLEVAPGVRWLRMPLPFALDHINLWLLEEADGWTLVDCGIGTAATRDVWELHFTHTLRDRPLKQIIVTHYHPDHIGNAQWLSQRFGVPVRMTQSEFLAAHAVIDQRASYSLADMCSLFAAHGMPVGQVAEMGARGNQYKRGVPEIPAAFVRMLAGDVVTAAGREWQVACGYGHSPEHAWLYAAEDGVAISGDMLLPRISTNVSVWPAEREGDPLGRFLASLGAFAALPAATLILPSHGLPFRGSAVRVEQLRAHHAARLAELEAALLAATAPVSASSMLPVLFRRELDVQQRFFAMGEAIAHLNHLWRNGRVGRTVTADGVRFAAHCSSDATVGLSKHA